MNTKIVFLALLIFFSCSGGLWGQENYKTLVFEGNQKFNANDYEGASSKFMEAVKEDGNDFTGHYNLGNALYKRKMYKEATAEYTKAEKLAQNLQDKAAVLHNLGNTMMLTNQLEKAADYYKQSLKQNPYNEQTRRNYEIAKLKQKEKQRKEGEKQQQKKGGESGDGNQKGDQQGPKDSKNKKQDQGSGDQGEGKEGDSQNKGKEGKMPGDLEKALLDSINGREKRTARRILNKESYSQPESNDKDW